MRRPAPGANRSMMLLYVVIVSGNAIGGFASNYNVAYAIVAGLAYMAYDVTKQKDSDYDHAIL